MATLTSKKPAATPTDEATLGQTPAIAAPEVIEQAPLATEAPVIKEITEPAQTPAPAIVEEVKPTEAPSIAHIDEAAFVKEAPVKIVEINVPVRSSFETSIDAMKARKIPEVSSLIVSMEQYISAMAPGKSMTPEHGNRQQELLASALFGVLNTQGDTFKLCWSVALAYFNEYKTSVFNERYVYRFSEYWTKEISVLSTFQRLINLMIVTADPETRAAASRQEVSIDKTLKVGFTDLARQNLLNFYGV